ncbi:MAG: Holliday junction branch migration protein RuvA [Spirochaetaceae bacterium]|jgi:Holliday junction DNA helicase RuvA|nr:Holliday junction branch migration protein RuvA [Spirochaetaceae bacterium]
MFNSLSGTITARMPSALFLDTGGIEWDITVPDTALDALPPVGERGRVFIWMYHREDQMKLFGFASAAERSVFLDLMKVEGIGPRGAVKILSHIDARRLAEVLEGEDTGLLEKLPGIGKKTAQKMLLTLKGKLVFSAEQSGSAGEVSPWQDIVLALVSMGFDKKAAEEAVRKIDAALGPKLTAQERESALFRQAIIALSS